MAADKRPSKRELKRMSMAMSRHQSEREAYRNKGDASGVARCEWLLKLDYSLIRAHCAEHNLELPHDVPPAGEG